MATDKALALKRVQDREDYVRKAREELDKNTIKFRWYVNEHTPAYNTGGYYDQDVPAKNTRVSDYYDNLGAAHNRMNELEPDPGCSLSIKRQRLVRRVYTEWISA